jgi:hypothetical protein
MSSEALSRINEITTAYADNVKAINRGFATLTEQQAALQSRLETLESGNDLPGAGRRTAALYTKHRTPKGTVYEVPSGSRLADVKELQPQKAPEVSLARWLRATVAGESCARRKSRPRGTIRRRSWSR